jgi:hypothetical protein
MNLLKKLEENLVNKDGIWVCNDIDNISYPSDGNAQCYQVENDSFWFNHRNKVIQALAQIYVQRDQTFLDVGGGNGFVSLGLQEIGYLNSALLEPGHVGCINAKARGLRIIINSTAENCNFFINSVPCVGAFDVVEHIQNDLEFVSTLNQMIVPGGTILITVPALKVLWSEEDRRAGHYRRYTRKSISKLLIESGFEVYYSSYFFSFLIVPIYLKRVLGSLLRFKSKPNSHEEINELDSNDHVKKNSLIGRIVNVFSNAELFVIRKLSVIPIGSSIIIVAKKKE